MYVAGSTECFPDQPLPTALQRLADLEFTRVEISVRDDGPHLRPADVLTDLDAAVAACRNLQRLTPVAYYVDISGEGPPYYEKFAACCKLAKQTKVVTLTVRSAELGTPFNAEIERLRELVRIAALDGIVVGLKTEIGRMSQDPDTAVSICDTVRGLGITLDPSHFVIGPHKNSHYDQVFRHVCHVQLRDSTKEQLQVRVGQGVIEYGRIVAMLGRVGYNRALSVDIHPDPQAEWDHAGELRKLRLLLDSLL